MVLWEVLQLEGLDEEIFELLSAYQEEADASYLEVLTAYCDMSERMLQHFNVILQQYEADAASISIVDDSDAADQFLTHTQWI